MSDLSTDYWGYWGHKLPEPGIKSCMFHHVSKPGPFQRVCPILRLCPPFYNWPLHLVCFTSFQWFEDAGTACEQSFGPVLFKFVPLVAPVLLLLPNLVRQRQHWRRVGLDRRILGATVVGSLPIWIDRKLRGSCETWESILNRQRTGLLVYSWEQTARRWIKQWFSFDT